MHTSEIESLLRSQFGIDPATCERLAGEVDHNTLVVDGDARRFVLKVHAPDTPIADLDMQDAALHHVADAGLTTESPRLIDRSVVQIDGRERVARLLSWIEGRPVDQATTTPELLRSIGQTVAQIDQALDGFVHPATERGYRWNMLQCGALEPASNEWASRTIRSFADVLPALRALPQQTIHNDANDDNIVVAADGTVSLIDYGDVVRGPRIVGLGVAAAYAMFGRIDPLAAAADVAAGYHEVAPLDPAELALLDVVVRTRLAMSITIAEMQIREQPDNVEYLTTSQASIIELVGLLDTVPTALAHATYRNACGYLPVAYQRNVEKFLGSSSFDPAPIVDDDLGSATILDWSHGAERSQSIPDDRPSLGRYGELRTIYDTEAFATPFGERRTLHLGIDVFVPAGQSVYSPLDGVMHSCDVRNLPGDYGGVVVIEYQTPDGVPFWLLVGHLAHESVRQLTPGQRIDRGAEFALVGSRRENGGWAPHLHVQLFTDLLGQSTDLDGVARASQRDVWTSISPNPASLIVGVGVGVGVGVDAS